MDGSANDVVLVTGGAGYIGAHVAKALSESGLRPIVFDNLSSGYREAVRWGPFVHGDIREERALREAMETFGVGAVIHLAGLIEVGRSVARPDQFYDHNLGGTAALLAAMRGCGVGRLVFSSSAAVYGQPPGDQPMDLLREDMPKEPSSPYGDTKLACERLAAAHCRAFGLSAVAFRYFNAAGADPSGLIGEAHDPETHLIPRAICAALGSGEPLTVFGNDFPTPDGACLRDYVHVNDLAAAHVAALAATLPAGGFEAVNLGGGHGHSVSEVIAAVEAATSRPVPRTVGPRRAGDPPSLVADATRAERWLGWRPHHSSLERIIADATAWHRRPRYGRQADPAAEPQSSAEAA